MKNVLGLLMFISVFFCKNEKEIHQKKVVINSQKAVLYDKKFKTIHILVALCDNKYQGIVPVPKLIGNGQDPKNNLYWGCGYGVKTYFKRNKIWKFLKSEKINDTILERIIFKHKTKDFYLVADAYNGKNIKKCTQDFLKSSSGELKDTLKIGNKIIGINGNSKLISYIGHDGLMDFQLNQTYKNKDNKKRDVIILACYSKHFFAPHLKQANVNPLVWSTGLMAPEAYIINDAIAGYVNNESAEKIRIKSALAYSKYQKCSTKASKRLLVTGW